MPLLNFHRIYSFSVRPINIYFAILSRLTFHQTTFCHNLPPNNLPSFPLRQKQSSAMNNNVNIISQVRQGTLLTPTTASSAPTVIALAEIYPYHRVRYPDCEDLDKYLSNGPCAAPFNKVLEQILKAFEVHVSKPLLFSSYPPTAHNKTATSRGRFLNIR